MKTLLLFSLFLIPLVNVQSQNTKLIWAPIGAIWEYRVGGLSSNHTCIITVLKDTIIDGVRAKKILNACTFSSANMNRYPEFYFIYQKSPDVIEYLINNHFSTLYDFSTKAGETILVKIKNNLDSIHDPCKDSIKLIKSLNTSQSIGGESLKFYNYNITQDIVNCGMSIGSNVFQIFGPLNGFLFPTYQVLESSFQLTRYTDTCWDVEPIMSLKNGIVSFDFKINRSCFTSSNHELKLNDKGLKIFPNPVGNKLYFQQRGWENKIQNISIYDLMGRSIHYRNNLILENEEYDVAFLRSGMYILKIKIAGQEYTQKIFKK